MEHDDGEKTDVAGVTGDISTSESSESEADEVVEADRLRFIGVNEVTSTPQVERRSLMSVRNVSKSAILFDVSVAINHGRYAEGRASLRTGSTCCR